MQFKANFRNRAIDWAIVTVAIALVSTVGCSFSKSSESISNSISSPFESSSNSSKSDETRYHEEVAEYSAAFAKAGGGSADAFQRGISKLAARRDINDWEALPATWSQVGSGLGSTDISEVEALAYAEIWSEGDEMRFSHMREGFLAER